MRLHFLRGNQNEISHKKKTNERRQHRPNPPIKPATHPRAVRCSTKVSRPLLMPSSGYRAQEGYPLLSLATVVVKCVTAMDVSQHDK